MTKLQQTALTIATPALQAHLHTQKALATGSVTEALSNPRMTLDTSDVTWPKENGTYHVSFVHSETGTWTVGHADTPAELLALLMVHAKLQDDTSEDLTMSSFYAMGNGLDEGDHPSGQDNLAARVSYEAGRDSETIYSVVFIPASGVNLGGLVYQMGSVPHDGESPTGDPSMWAPSLTLDGAKARAQNIADKTLKWKVEKTTDQTDIKRRWRANDSDTQFVIEEAVLQA